jgi:hypothetical protein
MQQQLRSLVENNVRGQKLGGEAVKVHREEFDKLRDSLVRTTREFQGEFAPIIEKVSFGVTAAGLAFGGLATGMLAAAGAGAGLGFLFQGQAHQLRDLSVATGLTVNQLRYLEALGPRIGSSSEQMAAGLQNVAGFFETMTKQGGWLADYRKMSEAQFLPWVRDAVGQLRNLPRFEQIMGLAGIAQRIPTEVDKRRFWAFFGLPENFANYSQEQIRQLLAETQKNIGAWSDAQVQAGMRADEAWLGLTERLKTIRDYIGAEFVPALNKAYDASADFLGKITARSGEYVDLVRSDLTEVQTFFEGVGAEFAQTKIGGWFAEQFSELQRADIEGGFKAKFEALRVYLASVDVGGWLHDVWARAQMRAGGDKTMDEVQTLIVDQLNRLKGALVGAAGSISNLNLNITPKYSLSKDIADTSALMLGNMLKLLDDALKGIEAIEHLPPIDWAKILGVPNLQGAVDVITDKLKFLGIFTLPNILQNLPKLPAPPPPEAPKPPPPEIMHPEMFGRGLPEDWRERVLNREAVGRGLPPPAASTPAAPILPQFAPGYSPIAFHPANGLPNPLQAGQASGKSDAIEIIAVGTRKGVAEGMMDFYQTLTTLQAGAGGRGGGGLANAAYEPPTGPSGLPGGAGGHAGNVGGYGGAGGGAAPGGAPSGPSTLPPFGEAGHPGGHAASEVGKAAREGAAAGAAGAGAVSGGRFMDALAQIESGNRNIFSKTDPDVAGPGTRSQGYFQINTPTWRDFAPKAGVDLSRYPNAMSAPRDIQEKVASTIPLSRFGPRTRRMLEQQFGFSESIARETTGQLAARFSGHGAASTTTAGGNLSGGEYLGHDSTGRPLIIGPDGVARRWAPGHEPKGQPATPATPASAPKPPISSEEMGKFLEQHRMGYGEGQQQARQQWETINRSIDREGGYNKPQFDPTTPKPWGYEHYWDPRHPRERPDEPPGLTVPRLHDQEASLRREPGSLLRGATEAGITGSSSAVHRVEGEASLKIKLAGGLAPDGGVKNKGPLFKEVRLDRAPTPLASTQA